MTLDTRSDCIRRRWLVRGMVQGIGFRPYVWRLARAHGLVGFVGNESEGAFLEIEGPLPRVAAFEAEFRSYPPPLSRVDAIEVVLLDPRGDSDFRIVSSAERASASSPVSADLAICDDCLSELFDPANRRYGYPFINCTQCGPRFTIIERLPYDRPGTTMHPFTMCAACEVEYQDPGNRRFHSQPNACWDCGPLLWLHTAQPDNTACEPKGREAIKAAARLLDDGGILALKGIGGFHLACDAANAAAVQTLRQRKGRAEKPFAVMATSVADVRRFAEVSQDEEHLMSGCERPIVLLRKRKDAVLQLADEVAPESPQWGVMLAYAPVHHLLLARPDGDSRVLVMTSGNWSEEPIARDNQEALSRLSPLADAFLLHDREIRVVADDSVVRVFAGREIPLRRSRGYAPLPVRLPCAGPSVLAVGGELKATFCLTKGDYAYLSQHIGDIGNLETQQAFERALQHFLTLYCVEPCSIVCDLHPGYCSTNWAHYYAAARELPLMQVQHHHAHIAALMAEHGLSDQRPLLGVAFDGTGYGDDGAIWGGEFLQFHRGDVTRLAHLRYVPLPGGDAAIRHPWRCAAAHLRESGLALPALAQWLPGHDSELPLLLQQMERSLHCIPTSSMGRLFDAVAAVLGLRHSVSFEAQAAMQLEALCEGQPFAEPYAFEDVDPNSGPTMLSPAPLWLALLADLARGMQRETIAARFHSSIAQLVLRVAEQARASHGTTRVGLSGGVFQNLRLLHETLQRLHEAGFETFHHHTVPPNDGGIALGQAWLAHARLRVDDSFRH